MVDQLLDMYRNEFQMYQFEWIVLILNKQKIMEQYIQQNH